MEFLGIIALFTAVPLLLYFAVATIAGIVSWTLFAVIALLGFFGVGLLSMSGASSAAGAFVQVLIMLGYFVATAAAAQCVRSFNRGHKEWAESCESGEA